MKQSNLSIRKPFPHSPSRLVKFPAINRNQKSEFSSKKIIAFADSYKLNDKLHPLKSSNDIIKTVDDSFESEGKKYIKKESMGKKKEKGKKRKGSLYRFHTQQNKKLREFSLPKSSMPEDSTLTNFKKNIMMNRQLIHEQMNRRHPSNRKSVQQQHSKEYLEYKKMANEGLFEKLKKVFTKNENFPKQHHEKQDSLERIKQSAKLMKILERLKKLHPEKSLHQIKKENMSESKNEKELKNLNNYHEWRRLQFQTPSPEYKESCFEVENERLITIAVKNEEKIKEYIESHEQLMKLNALKIKTELY